MNRRLVLPATVAAATAVGAAWGWLSLPLRAVPAVGTPAPTDIRLAYHVHTRRSDGTGSVDVVAAAARRAGVAAVVVTDHGDGVRQPDGARYLDGVLVIDGVEVSTWGGHYVAIGAAASPYPLGGEPDAVVDDVRRLGGIGLAAHPGSAKAGLKWRDWDAPLDGIEWLNADSEWRDRPADLLRAVVTYPWRPAETLAALLNRPSFEIGQWDRLAARRPVFGLAAHDAHARLGPGGVGEPYEGAVALEVPAYESMFRAFSNVVRLTSPLTGDAVADAARLTRAIAEGQSYAVVTGVAPPGRVHFSAASGGHTAGIGGHLTPAGPVAVAFDADVPAGAHATLYCDGRPVATGAGGHVAWTSDGIPGACRVEVVTSTAGAPWLVTNPIYVRPVLSTVAPRALPLASVVLPLAGSGSASRWTAELAPGARGAASAAPTVAGRVAFDWQLGPNQTEYAALRFDTSTLAGFDRVVVRAGAGSPMRVWLQLRTPNGGGARWGRSFYVDTTPREITIPFGDLLSLDGDSAAPVPLATVNALLFVVDTVHARPGAAGTLWFDELWVAR